MHGMANSTGRRENECNTKSLPGHIEPELGAKPQTDDHMKFKTESQKNGKTKRSGKKKREGKKRQKGGRGRKGYRLFIGGKPQAAWVTS